MLTVTVHQLELWHSFPPVSVSVRDLGFSRAFRALRVYFGSMKLGRIENAFALPTTAPHENCIELGLRFSLNQGLARFAAFNVQIVMVLASSSTAANRTTSLVTCTMLSPNAPP